MKSVYIKSLLAWCKIDFDGSAANPLSNNVKFYLNNEELTELTIPEELTEVKKYTFCGCKGIEKVTLGNEITSIGDEAFAGCRTLTTINIHDNVTNIGQFAFSYCALTALILDGVTSIGSCAFIGCDKLTSVVIGDGLAKIEYRTFENCSSLTSVKIGKNVVSIGESAFMNASISEFYSYATTPPALEGHNDWYDGLIHPFNDAIQQEAVLYVPVRCVYAYKSSSWGAPLNSLDGKVLFKNIKEMD